MPASRLIGMFLYLFGSIWPALWPMQMFGQCPAGQRRVTVADAIEMTHPELPGDGQDPASHEAAWFSPNGQHFAVVLKKGDLKHNSNQYRLLIYRTQDAFSLRRPEAIVKMSSTSNRDGITGVKWLGDNHTVLFIGEKPAAIPQIYSFDIQTKVLERRTKHPTPIVAFDASTDGKVIAFQADPPPQRPVDALQVQRTGLVVSTQNLSELLQGNGTRDSKYVLGDSEQLFLLAGGGRAKQIPIDGGLWPVLALSVSPNGRYVLVEAFVRQIPENWLKYKDRLIQLFAADRKQLAATSWIERYLIVDTTSGSVVPLLDAPKSWEHDGFVWVSGGRSIVLSKAYLPLAGVPEAERRLREAQTFVAEVALPSRKIVKITDAALTATMWDEAKSEILLESRDSASAVTKAYQKRRSSWSEVPWEPDTSRISKLRVTEEEDMNTPPKIWISDTDTGRKELLLDLNPQFAQLCFSREEAITWRATDGHEVKGGLYLPPDYKVDHRYPLVIQTHAFDANKFWIDGPWTSAFAAQPLAAKDIVVLQMGYAEKGGDGPYRSTPMEAPRQMFAFEGAIDALDSEGLIDRKRVGIIGFSRTVYHVAYTLTHSKYSFAAATLADGFNGGYFEQVASPNTTADPNAVNGGPPFGATMPLWLEHAPAFNLTGIKTPVRLESFGMGAVIDAWEWFSLSSQMRKPVELMIIPHGTHILMKPWDRLISQQGNVDWFAFWLNGEEDPGPSKRLQYARWRQLRELQSGGVDNRTELRN